MESLSLPPGALDPAVAAKAAGETEPVYLTAAEVAELLRVDEKTVSRWSLEDASMPVLRRGRVVRFHRERLMLWLERQEPRGSRQLAHRRPQGR
jgi:excisionase family DNA binding protein